MILVEVYSVEHVAPLQLMAKKKNKSKTIPVASSKMKSRMPDVYPSSVSSVLPFLTPSSIHIFLTNISRSQPLYYFSYLRHHRPLVKALLCPSRLAPESRLDCQDLEFFELAILFGLFALQLQSREHSSSGDGGGSWSCACALVAYGIVSDPWCGQQ